MENIGKIGTFFRKIKDSKRLQIIVGIVGICVIASIGYLMYYNSLIPAPIGSKEANEQSYKTISKQFKEAGYENITLTSVNDLDSGTVADRIVSSVSINEDNHFKKNTRFSKDADVVITYHDFSDKAVPSSEMEFYESVELTKETLENMGFNNVEVTELALDSGKASHIDQYVLQIDGAEFKEDYYYSKDSQIAISKIVLAKNAVKVKKFKVSSSDDRKSILEKLKKIGFTNITEKAIETDDTTTNNTLKKVTFNGKKTTKINDKILKKDTNIVVEYYDASKKIAEEKAEAEKKAAEEKAKKEAEDAARQAEAAQSKEAILASLDELKQKINNNEFGIPLVDDITASEELDTYSVYYNVAMLNDNNTGIKRSIQMLNEALVAQIRQNNGPAHPRVIHYIGGEKIGENRQLIDPREVKFESILD